MIAYNIKDALVRARETAVRTHKIKPKFIVYMGNAVWNKMMSELTTVMPNETIELLTDHGDSILGYPIFRVIGSNTHGWNIFDLNDVI